eukprot:6198639-Pleurochrysis_carterae.AAC.1
MVLNGEAQCRRVCSIDMRNKKCPSASGYGCYELQPPGQTLLVRCAGVRFGEHSVGGVAGVQGLLHLGLPGNVAARRPAG